MENTVSESNTITINDVSFSYPGSGKDAVSGVSFSVKPGEHIALVGPNGSGKTTLFKILNGTFRPGTGAAMLDNKNILSYPVLERARRIAYVPQGGRINFPYTCLELIIMGLHPYKTFSAFPGEADLFRAEEIMRKTGAWRFASKSINTLSGGELQLAFLTRALMQLFPNSEENLPIALSFVKPKAKLLLLDEALSELDIAARIGMMKLLNRTLGRERFTIIGIHHDLHLANRFANRVIALHNGRLAGDGPPDIIFTEEFFTRVFKVKAEIIPGKGFYFHDETKQ